MHTHPQVDKLEIRRSGEPNFHYTNFFQSNFPRLNQNSLETSYFRICKNGLHNDLSNISDDPSRFNQLLDKGIWYAKLIDESFK